VAALGVLKAGKIYVALEPSFPRERSRYILADTEASLILADGPNLSQARELAGAGQQVVPIEILAAGDASPPGLALSLDALAILNYTSGSTGQPKGVAQSHASAYIQAVRRFNHWHTSDADRAAVSGALAWTGSIWNVFGPLCLGASIAPMDIRRQGLDELGAWMQKVEPTLFTGRMLARQFFAHYPQQRFPSVRLSTMGGDTVFRQDAEVYRAMFPNAPLAVGLGLSEAGRATEFILDPEEPVAWDVLPLGLPAPGLQIKLVGDDDQEVEAGEVGEITVLGPGLAAGYWRRPELTASRFRIVPSLGPERAYFSGDLGRQTPDGLLHHMGRKDFMVKIRGYQVFTNEIEGLLRQVDGVVDVCVIGHTAPEGSRRLVAYLVVDAGSFPGVASLYAQFDDLPRHMAPQAYVFLDSLPKTPTGKADRNRLPAPRRSRLNVTAGYAAPGDAVEQALVLIWGKVLGIEGLGIQDNFLELGGDSLESIRITNHVVSYFQVNIAPSEFFSALTIAQMADIIRAARQRAAL
jgi:acyl-coenzyme A synthetase/AMP-(fatty) acid ligase